MALQYKLKAILDGNEGQKNLQSILNIEKKKLEQEVIQKKSNANLGILQGQLQRLFYPVGSTAISAEYAQSRMANATSQNIEEIFKNFDFENNKEGYHSASSTISPNTLLAAIEAAEFQIEAIKKKLENINSVTSKEYLNGLMDECRNIIQKGREILDKTESFFTTQFGQKRILKDFSEDAIVIVNQLKAFSSVLLDKDFVSPQEAGVMFEKALSMTNFVDNISNDVVDDVIRQLSEKAQYGSQSISRGVDGGFSVDYTISNDLKNEKTIQKDNNFKLSKNGLSIEYHYTPGAAKQGKMDVQLHYGQADSSDFRISAKRWTKGYGDLGETSIDAGLTRATGVSVAEAYKYAVLMPNKDQMGDGKVPTYMAAQEAHDLCKLALKTDIAMGLNQGVQSGGAGYANVLVVDYPEKQEIKVRNLADIVLDRENKYSSLRGYDESNINANALASYNAIKNIRTNRSDSYLALMSSSLNKMKVTINMSFRK